MQSVNFDEIVDGIVSSDPRYSREAYHLVREALDHTQRKVHKTVRAPRRPESRHVTGAQLLDGFRDHALQSFGPMTLFVLEAWGIRCCSDVGEIVFNLVDKGKGMFGKTDRDRREDFHDGYDFEEAFRQPFLPSARRRLSPRALEQA